MVMNAMFAGVLELFVTFVNKYISARITKPLIKVKNVIYTNVTDVRCLPFCSLTTEPLQRALYRPCVDFTYFQNKRNSLVCLFY